METPVSEIIIEIPDETTTTTTSCCICYQDDFEAEQMFSVGLCGHRFCVECMKKYVEVRLLEGGALRCPYDQCESMLSLVSFSDLLKPNLREMWERRVEEESIPVTERVYCPNPTCSVLMAKTELSKTTTGVKSCCVKCSKPFCVNCKVQWHNNLSCDDYKRLGPNPTSNDIIFKALANRKKWRQCRKCQHMIELSKGCSKLTCRCGYTFCYTCGTEWKGVACSHQELEARRFACLAVFFVFLVILIIAIGLHFDWFKIY